MNNNVMYRRTIIIIIVIIVINPSQSMIYGIYPILFSDNFKSNIQTNAQTTQNKFITLYFSNTRYISVWHRKSSLKEWYGNLSLPVKNIMIMGVPVNAVGNLLSHLQM